MPLPATYEDALLIDDLLAPRPVAVNQIPRAVFDLPPPMPSTNYFGWRGGRGGSDQLSVANKVLEYRMRQEAEAHADAIFEPLSQIDPASPDYPRLRQQLTMRFPLAVQSDRGKAMIDATDFAYEQARRVNPNQDQIEWAARNGVTAAEVAQFTGPDGTVDIVGLNNLAGQRQRALAPQRQQRDPVDEELRSLETFYRALDDIGPSAKDDRLRVAERIRQLSKMKMGSLESSPQAAPAKVTIKSITPLD